jgi:hypothetical protein
MCEESPLIKKIQIKPEQNACSCGCTGQKNVNFEKISNEQKPINQHQNESNK